MRRKGKLVERTTGGGGLGALGTLCRVWELRARLYDGLNNLPWSALTPDRALKYGVGWAVGEAHIVVQVEVEQEVLRWNG